MATAGMTKTAGMTETAGMTKITGVTEITGTPGATGMTETTETAEAAADQKACQERCRRSDQERCGRSDRERCRKNGQGCRRGRTGDSQPGGRRKNNQDKLLAGNIRQRLVLLAAPLLLGNMMQQCYHIADSWMIGRYLGMDAFAVVGVAGTVTNLMIFILNGFCTGVSVIFSTMYGAGDSKGFREEMFTAVMFGSAIAALLGILCLTAVQPLLTLIRTPEDLVPYAAEYLSVIAAGMTATYFYQLFTAVLRSTGNTGAGLAFLMVSVLGNVGLDYLLVAVWQMGIAGAAVATVVSQAAAAFGCLGYLCCRYGELVCKRRDMGIHRNLIRRTFRFGSASALQESNLYLGKILVQGAVNLLGTPEIAAFTAASRIEGFANSFGDSGALAVSVMVSQNRGAGRIERVKETLKQGILIHTVLGIGIPALMFLGAERGLGIFLNGGQSEALGAGTAYLRLISAFYILCFVGSAMVGFFRGIGKVHVPVIGTTLNIGTRVILSWKFTRVFGLAGLALATGIGWATVVSYQIWTFCRLMGQKKETCGE